MSHLPALRHAEFIYRHRDTLTPQNRVDAAVALGEWGLFSGRQIAKLTGLNPAVVSRLIKKTDTTGARLDPECLRIIIKLVESSKTLSPISRGHMVSQALEGTSTYFLAKLVGVSESTIRRWSRWRQ